MSLPVLNFESFIQLGGIYVKTIEDLFNFEIFYLARERMHVTFIEHFMELCKKKIVSLQVVRVLFDVPENEQRKRSVYEESTLLYFYLENFLYNNFWSWHRHSRGLDVSN
jgi:sugar-specific transcriptional regulator TrmB